ncbi:hypothetical protein L6164_014890 [Bauhinia variegata]|uniref:Uncharacterized protein n=1 Tax=Bauhinia variegata TaxID=167791 RepID=A0ACB9NJ26_BAUVA|nr:hypothetical protein L6164_014890 [Bauhinia variegata]
MPLFWVVPNPTSHRLAFFFTFRSHCQLSPSCSIRVPSSQPYVLLFCSLEGFMEAQLIRRILVIVASLFFLAVLAFLAVMRGVGTSGRGIASIWLGLEGGATSTFSVSHRKLLHLTPAKALVEPNRIWGDKCSKSDIVINQGPTAPLPSGIPTYTVEIMNMCMSGCGISGIHLRCGWFSSARLINPKVFKRLRFNDCLVNDGRPLVNGGTISFQYANTYPYPLSVSSVVCT